MRETVEFGEQLIVRDVLIEDRAEAERRLDGMNDHELATFEVAVERLASLIGHRRLVLAHERGDHVGLARAPETETDTRGHPRAGSIDTRVHGCLACHGIAGMEAYLPEVWR